MPIWLLALGFLASLLIAREVGYAFRRRRRVAGVDVGDDEAFAMTSVLGLLALLIGFTFSIALQRYDSRRELVIAEANALGTTWLRTELLEEPEREGIRTTLRRYMDARIEYGMATSGDDELVRYVRTEALQTELWARAVAAVASFKDSPRAALLLTPLNDSIDLAAERLATRQAHIPKRILRVLALFAFAAAALVGYERGERRIATTLLFVIFTLAVSLILDLDRPTTGFVSVPQGPMLDLRESMSRY